MMRIQKNKLRTLFMIMYLIMVGFLSFTAFQSPYMMENYANNIIGSGVFMFAVSYYMFDFKSLRIWFKDNMRAAKKRTELREAIKEGLKKKGF